MKKTILGIFISGVFLHAAVADSSVVIDWENSPLGEPPAVGSDHLPFFEWDQGMNTVKVVNGSEYPNFFPGAQQALLITQPDGKGKWAVPVFDFHSQKPLAKGSLTLNAMLLATGPGVLSGFNIVLAPEALEELVHNDMSSAPARIRLTGDFAVQVFVPASSGAPIVCDPRTALQTPYEVKIEWDLTASPPYFTVYLDGVPVSDREKGQKGVATQFPLVDVPASGIGAVMLRPRGPGSSYLIGRMEMGESLP